MICPGFEFNSKISLLTPAIFCPPQKIYWPKDETQLPLMLRLALILAGYRAAGLSCFIPDLSRRLTCAPHLKLLGSNRASSLPARDLGQISRLSSEPVSSLAGSTDIHACVLAGCLGEIDQCMQSA